MDDRGALVLLILAGAGLYLWSTQAGAAVDDSGDDSTDLSGDASTNLDSLLYGPSGGVSTAPASTIDDSGTNGLGLSLDDLFGLDDTGDGTSDGSDMGTSAAGSSGSSAWQVNAYPTYAAVIANVESQYGIPSGLLGAQLYAESSYEPAVISGYTRSSTGATGIAQFEPATAAQFGLQLVKSSYNGTPTTTYDPVASIGAAGKYMSQLHAQFGDWFTALFAYQSGPGFVAGWIDDGSDVSQGNAQAGLAYADKITSFVPVG